MTTRIWMEHQWNNPLLVTPYSTTFFTTKPIEGVIKGEKQENTLPHPLTNKKKN